MGKDKDASVPRAAGRKNSEGDDEYWFNATPLSTPANPWGFLARILEKQPGQKSDAVKENIAWLRAVEKEVSFEHNDPLMLLSIAQLTLDQDLRWEFMEALTGVEVYTRQALKAQKGGGDAG